MEHVDMCKTQIDKVKRNDSFAHRKSSKRSKSEKKKVKRGNTRKHKEKRKRSSSNSESDDSATNFEWVEKNAEDQVSSRSIENLIDRGAQENLQLKRDEWMNVESFIQHSSIKPNQVKSRGLDTKEEDKTEEILTNKPGQSDRELNPYWKDGGDGLPESTPDNPKILDANWLKRSLRRVEEQAFRDGKCLEEAAAERWGSLETIRTMILEAERTSNARQNKSYRERYRNDDDKNDNGRISNPRIRKHSRSASRSRSRSSAEKYTTLDRCNWSLQHRTESKRTEYRKPKDDDDRSSYRRQATPASSRIKSWKNDESDEKKRCYSRVTSTEEPRKEVERSSLENINNTNEMGGDSKGVEANKLGARIIKAELMGDDELAAQLKIQLERARKHAIASRINNNTNVQGENVILTRTDAKGTVRPIQPPRSQSKRENYRKNKIAETHISGEGVRQSFDVDRYSLQEMFQREKGRSANEDEAVFVKLTSKSVDHTSDDTFERQIARTDSRDSQDDRAQAIKEHKILSKRMDNCWWCLDSKNMSKHMIVTVMDSAISLSLPAFTSLSTGHCILTPVQHVACQLQLDEDVWDRLKELKNKLIKMFTDEDLYPIFFEAYKKRCKFSHMQLECIPLPKKIGELAPIYFKKALSECEIEWSINKKIVDLTRKGIRHAIPNGLSYFMVEFASHPGYAHVIEDEETFPQNFAKEIIGGMLDLDHNLWRKPKRQSFEEQRIKVLEFTEKWKKYNSS